MDLIWATNSLKLNFKLEFTKNSVPVNWAYSLLWFYNLLTSTEITVSESLKFMILLSILNMVSLFGSGQRFFNLVDLSNLGLGLCGY